MRVLFIVPGMNTHYLQMAPLAWAFRTHGHEVRVATQPRAAGTVTSSGMNVFSIARDYDFLTDIVGTLAKVEHEHLDGERMNIDRMSSLPSDVIAGAYGEMISPWTKLAEAMAGDLMPFVESWPPDLVVTDPLMLAAPLVAETAGAPLVHFHIGLAYERRNGFPGCSSSGSFDREWPEELRDLFDRFEVEVRPDYSVCNLNSLPASMQFSGIPNSEPLRFIPYNGPGVAPKWLTRPVERRRVCVTWGAPSAPVNRPFKAPSALTALADLDVDVIVAVARLEREHLREIPPNARVVEELPLNLLLPTCDAVVHHGGMSTMLSAMTYSVPQVVMGLGGVLDQDRNAKALASTGAGIALFEEAAGEEIASSVSTVLSEGKVRDTARDLREEILARPAPSKVVKTLEKLV